VTSDANAPDLALMYAEARERLLSLLAGLDAAALAAPVPACPRWTVVDVVAHLAAIAEDSLAGKLTGPPSEEYTAGQVARFRDQGLPGILAAWERAAPRFGQVVGEHGVWPAVLDLTSHEQDIRGAVGQPGARDCTAVREGAGALLSTLRPPVPLRVEVEDGSFRSGPPDSQELRLRTTRYEAFRWRLGRRSKDQLAAMDWDGDPAPVLGHLTIFGPATRDVVE
jgi:uncharacterized protein (TIGR03083 family)